MLKLQYSKKNDEFQICTVLGDFDSIYDLYYKLKDVTTISNIKIHDIGSGMLLNMNKSSQYNRSICSRLNTSNNNIIKTLCYKEYL